MHQQKASTCVSSPSPGCAATSCQTLAPPLLPQQLQGCSQGQKEPERKGKQGPKHQRKVTVCLCFGQPLGDSGMIPSLLPSLSSSSFTNPLPSCPGRGAGCGSGGGFPTPPGLCLPPAVTCSCAAAPSWRKALVWAPAGLCWRGPSPLPLSLSLRLALAFAALGFNSHGRQHPPNTGLYAAPSQVTPWGSLHRATALGWC